MHLFFYELFYLKMSKKKEKRNGFLLGRLCYYSLTGSYDCVHCSGPSASNFNQGPCVSPCEVSPSLSLEDKMCWLGMIFHHLVEYLGLLTVDLVWFCCLMGINCLLFMSWSPDWLSTHKHCVSMSVTHLLLESASILFTAAESFKAEANLQK